MARISKGIGFLLLGCMLLLVAGGWYIYNIFEDKSAGRQAKEILDKLNSLQGELVSDSVITIESDAFCGKVIIEKLGIELPVYDEWNYARLKTAPCRYTGGIETNNIIIAGHNYKSHFGSLGKLQAGDRIIFKDAYGRTNYYEVCEVVELDGTAVLDMHSGGWDFTLFTCTKDGEQRVTVRCQRKE